MMIDGYKWPLAFSDEELRLMKQELMVNDHDKMIWKNVELRALLFRLEAAEEAIRAGIFPDQLDNASISALNKWLEVCGHQPWRKASGK